MYIIVNADDFGKNPVQNKAIDDAFKQGMISSAGTIVTGNFFQDAVSLADAGGYIDKLHLHFNFSANFMQGNSEDAPLTEAMKKDTFFCKEGKFKKYKGLSNRLSDIRKWRVVYNEMVAQYNLFKEVTRGKSDYKHIDFHLWNNLTWPVSIALNLFTWKYQIETVRYWPISYWKKRRYKLFRILSWNPHVKSIPACSIFYFLTQKQSLSNYHVVELFCHPNYKDGIFIDDTPSYLYKDRRSMQIQITELKLLEGIEFMSWKKLSCVMDFLQQ